jgi:hypothetical protein
MDRMMPNKLQSQVFTTPGAISWAIPSGVTSCLVDILGAGGGTIDSLTNNTVGGGGSGEYCQKVPLSCNSTDPWVSGGAISGVVGAGGGSGTAGGLSSFGPFECQGGDFGRGKGGSGGGIGGGVLSGGGVNAPPGTYEYNGFTGGSAGGDASSASQNLLSGFAINFPGQLVVGGPLCGGVGSSSPFGLGALGGNEFHNGSSASATSYGAGGGGGGGAAPNGPNGSGAGGRIQVTWVS